MFDGNEAFADAGAMAQAAAGLRHFTADRSGGDYADGCDGQCDQQG
ncbi:hypothetical protein OG474_15300 [Kribbella sp. NBC_01505]